MIIHVKYLWNFFVFFIFVFYFNELNKNRLVNIHTSSNEKLSQNPSILFCVSLIKNCKNTYKEYGDFKNTKNKFKMMDNFICHINKNIPKNPKYIIEEAIKWNFFDAFERNKEKTVDKDIFLYDYHLCANFDLVLNFSQNIHNLKFSMNNIISKIYLYPASKFEFFLGEEIINCNDNENKKYISSLVIKQMIIFRSNKVNNCLIKNRNSRPYKCSKIFCYQSCYKNKINSYRFLFTKNDDFLLKVDNETTNPVDHDCFNKCHKSFYGYFYYIKKIEYQKTKTHSVELVFDPNVREIIPKNLTTKDFFVLETLSLLGVLFNFNFLDFLTRCFTKLVKKFKLEKNILKQKIKFFILIFVSFFLLINCLRIIKIYKNFLLINTTALYLPIKYKPFSFSPCFDIKTIINNENLDNLKNLKEPLESNDIFSLEAHTSKFANLLIASYFRYITDFKKNNVDKVKTFYTSEWILNDTKLAVYKCFLIYINVSQTLIQNLLESSSVTFNFTKLISFYYLTSNDFYPTSMTTKVYHKATFTIRKKSFKGDKSILNCKTYKENCFSQRQCIDKCFVKNYFNKFSKLPSGIPISFTWFEKKLINSLSFHLQNKRKIIKFKTLESFCLASFPLKDCSEKNYKTFKNFSKYKTNFVEIFLHEHVEADSKIIFFNKYELISKILTSINIWLGLSIPNSLKSIIFKINKKVFVNFNNHIVENPNLLKRLKILLNLIIFFCLIYHFYLLSEETLKQSKVTKVKYRFSTEIEYPYITICLDYKKKINLNKNLSLNGNLLDNLTINANDVFKSITYLDNDLVLHNQTNFKSIANKKKNILSLKHFYFMKYKCFKLKYRLSISYYQYLRKKDSLEFLTIQLNKNIKNYLLYLESNVSSNFRNIMKMTNRNNVLYFFKVIVLYEDLYIFLKDPTYYFKQIKSINFNEGNSYSNFLRKKFKESRNKSTLLLPLEQKYFNLTIDDEEFLEFYETEMVKLEKQNVDNSYLKVYFHSIISHSKLSKNNQLKLKPKFFLSETIITDKIPVQNFFLSFLNIFSFWFNLSLINIFQQFKIFLNFNHQLINFLNFLFVYKIKRFFFSSDNS